jgi:hypothetical protein
MIATEFLCRIKVTLEPVRDLGDTPLGRRRIIGITGGSFSGARLSGRVLPGGADWQLIRADGSAYLDARYTLETSDGALIYVSNHGYRHGPQDVIARVARGEDVDPAQYYMRTTPWFETAAPAYAWLNRIVCVGTGARRADCVELEFFEVK